MVKITAEYCSRYKSYNGEKVTEGKVLAPVLISEDEFKNNDTIIPENLTTWKYYGIPFRTGFMVSDAADFNKMLSLYNSCVLDYLENQHPGLRPGKCLLEVDNNGLPIPCNKENICDVCFRCYENPPCNRSSEDYLHFISFQNTPVDGEGSENNLDIADPKANTEDSAVLSVLFSQLIEYLEKENPLYAAMVLLSTDGYSKEEIFETVGLKSGSANKEWSAARAIVKAFLDL